MTTLLVIAGAAIAGAGTIPYILAVLKGRVRPRLVSWGVWAALSGVMAVSAYVEGETASAVLALQAFVSCTTILVLGWRRGQQTTLSKLDIVCLVGAGLGIASLALFRNPVVALAIALAVDAVAFVPTLVHGWLEPSEESLACFVMAAMGGVLAGTAALQSGISFAGLAYPVYSTLFNGTMAMLLVVGRYGWNTQAVYGRDSSP